MFKISKKTRFLIREALREDIGKRDITTEALVPQNLSGEAHIDVKQNGIFSGGRVAFEIFRQIDPKLVVKQRVQDGKKVRKGQNVLSIRGRVRAILKGERVALNFLSRLSGIATLTHEFAERVRGTHAGIFDTRKTTPLWRELEKYAVRCGGGKNHRFGLWDEILVKDNHWVALRSLPATKMADPSFGGRAKSNTRHPRARQNEARSDGSRRSLWRKGGDPDLDSRLRGNDGLGLLRVLRTLAMTKRRKIPIEVEVANLTELSHLLKGDFCPARVLLDNFSVRELKKAVQMVKRMRSKILLEASGGITLSNVREVAKTGVDRISVGVLTHSAPALDVSLTLDRIDN